MKGTRNTIIQNKMKQNDDKAEFIIFIGLQCQPKKIKFDGIQIGHSKITTTDKSRNLAVIFEKKRNPKYCEILFGCVFNQL